jgi:hypothetical protein
VRKGDNLSAGRAQHLCARGIDAAAAGRKSTDDVWQHNLDQPSAGSSAAMRTVGGIRISRKMPGSRASLSATAA